MSTEGQPQIVITGIGLVTCLGLSAEETWAGVLTCRRAMGRMPALESPLPTGRTGGEAPALPASFMPGLPREVRYLRWAIDSALAEYLHPTSRGSSIPFSSHRIGIVLGTTLHGIRQGGQYLRTGNAAPMEQFLSAAIVRDALAGLPIEGPAFTTCSACSSGLGAIALGMTLLRTNQVDLVIAGGYDPVSEYVYAGFDSLRLVAESDTRPFAKNRDGMKIAEGYAVVALQRAADAHSRKPLARVLGYGETSDSHHLTQPHPGGEGACRAARAALAAAGLPPQAIGLVSAHATATPNNDAAEFAGISLAFGDRTKDLPVVAFKSHVGHTLGAAGATELILSLLAMRDQTFPPTANTAKDDLEFPVRVNLDIPRPTDIPATMNLSLGFGGSNAAMVLGRSPGLGVTRASPAPAMRPVLITGVGFVAPNVVGNEAFRQLLADPSAHPKPSGHLEDSQIAHLLNARRVRRMSEYAKATLAATSVACQDASITDIPAFAVDAAAILGTCLGSSSFCESYYRPITKDGLSAANPALFAEGVPNAAAAQLSLMFQVKGPCQTIIGSRTAGVDALYLAALRIASGEWERAIVSAGEEFHETAVEIYKALGLYSGGATHSNLTLSAGAVTFILESEPSAASRGVQPRAMVNLAKSGAVRAGTPGQMVRAATHLLSRLGPVRCVVSSANGTWLDRVEAAAIRRALPGASTGYLDYIPDLASAQSLAGLAAVLLSGRIPCASPPETHADIAILATDYAGLASAMWLSLASRAGQP